jgi:hypothetical protein
MPRSARTGLAVPLAGSRYPTVHVAARRSHPFTGSVVPLAGPPVRIADGHTSLTGREISRSCRQRACVLRRTPTRPSPRKGIHGHPQVCAQPGGEPLASGEWAVDNWGWSVDQPCTGSSCPRGGRVVPEFSPGSTHRRRYVATWGYEGYPHNPQHLLRLLNFSSRVINKEKAGGACARTRASRSGSQDVRGRLERRKRTLYGDEQRLVFPRGGVRSTAPSRVWKGLS